jgi:D-alanine-D-alanine ligase
VEDAAAKEAERVALEAWKCLGCRDAGRIDLRADERGRPELMELNPLAGLHPEHSDLCIIAGKAGLSYRFLIESVMVSALKRTAIHREPVRAQA